MSKMIPRKHYTFLLCDEQGFCESPKYLEEENAKLARDAATNDDSYFHIGEVHSSFISFEDETGIINP